VIAGATPARHAALEVLRAVRDGALADRALLAGIADLPVRDRAWTQELVYGTLRLRGRLDHKLVASVRRPLAALDADVLDILRLGTYQLDEMDSVPPYAAISQSVELARSAGAGRAAGFVNAVLQHLHRDGGRITFPRLEADPLAHLTTWGSHPRWLVERWIARFGVDAAAALVDANNRRPALYLRAAGARVDDVVARLAAEGIATERVDFAPDALRLIDGDRLGDALRAAPVIVQDPAAGLVVGAATPPAGARVADVCAAPGGKAIGLAAGRDGVGPRIVVAADVSGERLARLRDNLGRLRALAGTTLAPIVVIVADARRPPLVPVEVVLVDAPCTGTGTLRRHPDGRWRIESGDLVALTALQRALLAAAAGIVAPGGLLVYATCSLEEEENERQVEAFLRTNPEFEPEPVRGVDVRALDEAGRLRALPHVLGVDGAFAARLRRRRSRSAA
jgi:16S rRNA (cytosine967-C5)-methyltransferase